MLYSGFMSDLRYVLSESPGDFGLLMQEHAGEN